jgi:localization factor PodJL
MIRAAAWAGANPGEETERYATRRGESRIISADRATADVDGRLQRMESMLNSLLEGLQSAAPAEKTSRPTKDPVRPRQTPGDGVAELGYRPQDREQRAAARSELQRRQWSRPGSAPPGTGKDKVTAFKGSRLDDVATKRLWRTNRQASPAGSDDLQTDIANVAEALRGFNSRDSIGPLERAVCDLAEAVEGLRSESVNETVLQPLERLVTELRHSLALTDPPKRTRGTELRAARLAAEIGRPKIDHDAFDRIEQQTNEVRELFTANAERARVVEPLQRRPRAENSDRQRAAATGGGAFHDDVRAFAKIEEKLEAIAANIEEVTAQSRDQSRYDALSERIDDVRQELTTRIAEAWLSPDTKPLEELLHGLSEKLENVQNSPAAKRALESLERQVTDLSERFERANAQFPSLASIEMAIGDLFTELERTRQVALDVAERTARNVLNEASADGALNSEISHEIQRLMTFNDDANRRTLSTLTTIHDVLAKLVDRLAIVEEELSERKPSRGDATSRPSSGYVPPQQREAGDSKSDRISQAAAAKRAEGKMRADGKTSAIPISELEDPATVSVERFRDADLRDTNLTLAAYRAAQAAVAENVGGGAPVKAGLFRRICNILKRSMILSLAAGFIVLGAYILANDAGPRHSINLASNTKTVAAESRPRDPPMLQASTSPPQISPEVPPAVSQSPQPSTLFSQSASPSSQSSARPAESAGASAPDSEQVAETSPPQQGAGAPKEPIAAPEAAVPPSPSQPSMTNASAEQSVEPGAPAAKQRHFAANPPRDLRVAAEGGDSEAQFALATYYAQSHNLAAAARWFRAAAAQGLAPAQFRLGLFYQDGLGIGRDLEQANSWYLKAAEQGNVSAMYNLALLAANGKPDYPTAARWFKQAAEYGLHNGQYNFAVLLAYGLGVKRDLVSSYAWFAIAAAQGDHGAAEKRDEVGAKLDPAQLSAANGLVAAFHPKTPDHSANEVPRRDVAISTPPHESASITK